MLKTRNHFLFKITFLEEIEKFCENTDSLYSDLVVIITQDLEYTILQNRFECLFYLLGALRDRIVGGCFALNFNHTLLDSLFRLKVLPILVKRLKKFGNKISELFSDSPASVETHLLDESLIAQVAVEGLKTECQYYFYHYFKAG